MTENKSAKIKTMPAPITNKNARIAVSQDDNKRYLQLSRQGAR